MSTTGFPANGEELSAAIFEDRQNTHRPLALKWLLFSDRTWIGLLTLAAAILRIMFLGSKSLWLDEGQAFYRASLPLRSLLHVVTDGQMNMSLYYLILHLWMGVAGSSESMLRLPEVFFSIVTVPLTYLLGRELGNRRAGLIAALMLSLNATCIGYAQMVRSYSLFVALVTLGSIFFVRSLKRDSPFNLGIYLASSTGSVYAHLFGILALPSQWLSLLLFRPNRTTAIKLAVSMLAIAMLGVPAFFFAIHGDHGNVDWVPRTSLRSVTDLFVFLAGGFNEGMRTRTRLLLGLYLVGIVAAVWPAPPSGRFAASYLMLSICVPIALTIAISLHKPLFQHRYLLAELPPFALLAAIGFQRTKPALAIAMVLAVSMLSVVEDYSYYTAPSLQDWRGVVDFVAKHAQPGDELVVYPDYFNHTIGYYICRLEHPASFPATVLVASYEPLPKLIDQLLSVSGRHAGSRRIWLTFPASESIAGIQALQKAVASEGVVIEPYFNGAHLILFEDIASDYQPRPLSDPGRRLSCISPYTGAHVWLLRQTTYVIRNGQSFS